MNGLCVTPDSGDKVCRNVKMNLTDGVNIPEIYHLCCYVHIYITAHNKRGSPKTPSPRG